MAVPSPSSRTISAVALAACLAFASGLGARQSPAIVTDDLAALMQHAPESFARVIVQGDVSQLTQVAARHGLILLRTLDEFVVVLANAAQVQALTVEPAVKVLSTDLPVMSAMTVSDKTLAADRVRAGSLTFPGVNGAGVTVAVVDSGIASHRALMGKVRAAMSFIEGDPRVTDRFGHGTHIAGIIAGQGFAAGRVTTEYSGGIAPGADLVNVRVLGDTGVGLTSGVIAGLDWVLANRGLYNIRVVNVSLGHVATAPCSIDALCQTVGRLVQAGLVVVVSAGNRGTTENDQLHLGTITSPGTSPLALTIGATNTWETIDRSDDTVTTYSSRGPAPYEFWIKPDVVAPGNKIVSLEAQNSYLADTYPSGHVAGSGNNAYYRMSGTSMSAAMISGGAALLLSAQPTLLPSQIKAALQFTATFMPHDGLMAAGFGNVNLWNARRLAATSYSALLPTGIIGSLLEWTSGNVFDLQERLGLTPLGADGASHVIWGDIADWTDDNHVIWGDQIVDPEGQHVIWGDQIFDSSGQQLMWGDQTAEGYHVIWGDTYIPPEGN